MAKQVTKTGLIRVYIRLTQDEYEDIKRLAANEDQDASDWLREAVGCQMLKSGFSEPSFFDNSVSGGESGLATN